MRFLAPDLSKRARKEHVRWANLAESCEERWEHRASLPWCAD